MTQKIHARRVMKMGREPKHSLMVTIPRKICNELQIEKGTRLYFKPEGNHFVVSKDSKFLAIRTENGNDDTTTIDAGNDITKEKKKNVMVHGISLADLQY
ncbi:MAG: AbrB/MazE/SpoVT family DNA-binding domain-containing protein [Thaumarchaeota archaeon]|nr:AbrB/MazE/SpoVT family DNA-binding domain-containing protein [Nitrososphaerota archaeon]